jgi:uncharacterized low-complexity protein
VPKEATMKKTVVQAIAVSAAMSGAMWLGVGPAWAVKPAQGSEFETGTCTTTTGHGSNAIQETDNGNCGSADNPNKGGSQGGTNTGHGFVPDPE